MRLGVVTGLRIEAGRFAAQDPLSLIATGAGAGAREACRRLLDDGAQALLGLGLAGGLEDDVGPGEIILADDVRLPSGALRPCDGAWRAHLQALLLRRPWTVRTGTLLGSEQVIGSPAEKRELAATGAIAVDTESHHLAIAAGEAAMPFAVIRVVADRAQDHLPVFAADTYDDGGRLRLSAVLGGLLRHPGELPALLRLARQSRQALAVLGGVGRLGAALGPP